LGSHGVDQPGRRSSVKNLVRLAQRPAIAYMLNRPCLTHCCQRSPRSCMKPSVRDSMVSAPDQRPSRFAKPCRSFLSLRSSEKFKMEGDGIHLSIFASSLLQTTEHSLPPQESIIMSLPSFNQTRLGAMSASLLSLRKPLYDKSPHLNVCLQKVNISAYKCRQRPGRCVSRRS
jgi:hypothetical protein